MNDHQVKPPPNRLRQVGTLLLLLFLGTNLAYHSGDSEMTFFGAKVSFQRQFDYRAYRVDAEKAFLVGRDDFVSLASYQPSPFPYNLLCGRYQIQGIVIHPQYQRGDWLYREDDGAYGAVALNLTQAEAQPEPGELLLEARYLLSAKQIERTYPRLELLNESCLVFNTAYLVLGLLWALTALYLFFRKARPRPSD